jgi:hypothetical protein
MRLPGCASLGHSCKGSAAARALGRHRPWDDFRARAMTVQWGEAKLATRARSGRIVFLYMGTSNARADETNGPVPFCCPQSRLQAGRRLPKQKERRSHCQPSRTARSNCKHSWQHNLMVAFRATTRARRLPRRLKKLPVSMESCSTQLLMRSMIRRTKHGMCAACTPSRARLAIKPVLLEQGSLKQTCGVCSWPL